MDGASPSTTIHALPADPFVYSSGWACPIHAAVTILLSRKKLTFTRVFSIVGDGTT